MGLLVDATEGRNLADEVQKRSELVHAYFSHMDASRWQGMKQDDLVGCVEALHQKLAVLGPQGMRDSKTLQDLKDEYTAELPVLGNEIDGLVGMSAYDVLLNIAKGQTNFSVPPLSVHRDVPQE